MVVSFFWSVSFARAAEPAEPAGGVQVVAVSVTTSGQTGVAGPGCVPPLVPDGVVGPLVDGFGSPPSGCTVPWSGSVTGVRFVEPSGLRMPPSGVVIEPSGLTLFGGTTRNFQRNEPSVPQTSTWLPLITVAVPS